MFKQLHEVSFPAPSNIWINMMPIIAGDVDSIPKEYHHYLEMIDSCNFPDGDTIYLSIRESNLRVGEYQSRPGLHTEGITGNRGRGWGGGWGRGNDGRDGIFMASNDGSCLLYDCLRWDGDEHGAIESVHKSIAPHLMKQNTMYWITDRTPHEACPASENGIRQWFRLVSPQVDIWFSQHSTANPLGVMPQCEIIAENKFE